MTSPNQGKITYGRSYDYFKKLSVSRTTFGTSSDGYAADVFIQFPTVDGGVIFINETATSDTKIVEYSFNGTDVHGEMSVSTASLTKTFTFYKRNICKVWFRVKSGSTGPLDITVHAWSGS